MVPFFSGTLFQGTKSIPHSHAFFILKIQVGERLNAPAPQFTKVQKLGNQTQESHSKHNCHKLGWKGYCSKNKQNFKKTISAAFPSRKLMPSPPLEQVALSRWLGNLKITQSHSKYISPAHEWDPLEPKRTPTV